MFHKAALTSRHEIKMFVEPGKWEMTSGDQEKAEEGRHTQRHKDTLETTCLSPMEEALQLGPVQTGGLTQGQLHARKLLACMPLAVLMLSIIKTEPMTTSHVLIEL